MAAPALIDPPLDISEVKVIEKFVQAQEIKKDYKLQGARFIKEAPNENEIRIEVGGVSEFEPALRLSRWDNEVHFKIKPRLQGIQKKNRKLNLEGNKIKLDVGKKKYHFYEIENAYEFEVILKEKPTTNIISLDIETQGLAFYYQPALDIEMAGQDCWTATCTATHCCDCHRPVEVVESYAVYHSTKQGDYSKMGLKDYKAGKAFHIYRPKIIDAEGTEVWGKLNITDNLLTVEIPQEFLDNAVYPVRHAAGLTFGIDPGSPGGSSQYINANTITGSKFTLGSAGTASSVSFHGYGWGSNRQVAIYTDAANPVRNGYSGSFVVGSSPSSWNTGTITTGGSLTADDWWLLANGAGTGYYSYDSGGTDKWLNTVDTFGDWTTPLSSPWTGDFTHSFYCTYTAGGGEEEEEEDYLIIFD